MASFGVDIQDEGDGVVLVLRGELDLATGPQLLEGAAGIPPGPVELDCRELAFLDPSGLAALVRLGRQLDRGPLRLRGVRPNVLLLLEHAGIRHAFAVVDDRGQPVPW